MQAFTALLAEDPPVWVAAAYATESRALAHAMFLNQHLPADDTARSGHEQVVDRGRRGSRTTPPHGR